MGTPKDFLQCDDTERFGVYMLYREFESAVFALLVTTRVTYTSHELREHFERLFRPDTFEVFEQKLLQLSPKEREDQILGWMEFADDKARELKKDS
jgi:hypothetical protein